MFLNKTFKIIRKKINKNKMKEEKGNKKGNVSSKANVQWFATDNSKKRNLFSFV